MFLRSLLFSFLFCITNFSVGLGDTSGWDRLVGKFIGILPMLIFFSLFWQLCIGNALQNQLRAFLWVLWIRVFYESLFLWEFIDMLAWAMALYIVLIHVFYLESGPILCFSFGSNGFPDSFILIIIFLVQDLYFYLEIWSKALLRSVLSQTL